MSVEPIDPATESAVVDHMLGRTRGLSTAELLRALRDVEHDHTLAAIESLIAAGVLSRTGNRLHPTVALAHLDSLGMVCI